LDQEVEMKIDFEVYDSFMIQLLNFEENIILGQFSDPNFKFHQSENKTIQFTDPENNNTVVSIVGIHLSLKKNDKEK